MPRKKLSDCSEHVKLMKVLKARLIEISLKVDNYIYKQKPITKLQAKAFLNEISTYKSRCQNDIGYIQVIEKLTKYMKIIISNKTKKSPVNDVKLNHENVDASKNTTLTKENLLTPTATLTENINYDTQNKTHKTPVNQNSFGLTLDNEPPSGTVVTSGEKYESGETLYNTIEGSNIKKAVDLKKGAVPNISSTVLENGAHIECYNETNIQQNAHNTEKRNEEFEDNRKAATNNVQTSLINKVQSPLKNDYSLLICVEGGVINEIKHLSNAAVIHQAPELKIPLNAFVLNNTKIPNTISETAIQNNLKIKSREEAKSVPANDKSSSKVKKINNKKVKFTAPYHDVTKVLASDPKKSDDDNNKVELHSALIPRSSDKNIIPKKQRTRKNVKGNTINKSREVNDKKSKQQTIKRKVYKSKKVLQKNLSNEVKSSSNEINETHNDLSWFDNMKYLRKIDEKEYFKPLQPLDDNFWYNPNLLPADARDFNM